MRYRTLLILALIFSGFSLFSQEKDDVFVDDSGLMRWGHNDEEVKGFGVNYSVPFAHAYRSAKKLGVDLKEAIDKDVYHFSRLGFNLYRIHVWDTEISDEEGNLIENEHLELFDYLLKKLKERDINFVITPIAYWGNGWPEPDEDTPGFSDKFGKAGSLTNPEAIKAQENYLKQFLEHVNPHTGVAYKDEPNIIAFEISNEPHHKGRPKEVTEFVNRMRTSMRSTGTKKPIFYNVTHSIHLADAYFDAGIDGGTFQWYPTGLVFQKELEGNLLPNVNDYNIPFADVIKKHNAAKLVYEFDAADVMKSYIYPAMARSFREAGIQIGTHFAYDPTYLAEGNTEYNTHYMNLAYTPQKALSLMIAGEVFHKIPLNSDFGTYPENKQFGDFSISYEKDLAVLNSEEKFIYTNKNTTAPKFIEQLKLIAGFGNSEVVKYEGKGAYFLDKLDDGVWRLEVMPDAILVDNPFGSNSLQKTVAVINHKTWPMKVNLPDLKNFKVETLNEGNEFTTEVHNKKFDIQPGSYLLKNEDSDFASSDPELKNFEAPESTVEKTYVIHEAVKEIGENSVLNIKAEIVSNKEIEKVEAWLQNGNTYENVELKSTSGYYFEAEIPEKFIKQGFLKYRIVARTEEGDLTFPGAIAGNPGNWDFYGNEYYKTAVVPESSGIKLFEAEKDEDYVVGEWLESINLVPNENGEVEYRVISEELFKEDEENPDAKAIYDYSFRYNFSRKTKGRAEEFPEKSSIKLKARSLNNKNTKLQVALIMKNGASFGKTIALKPEIGIHEIKLDELEPVQTVSLPRPYPSFLPYYFQHNYSGPLEIEKVEALQFSIGPDLSKEEQKDIQGVGIIHAVLE